MAKKFIVRISREWMEGMLEEMKELNVRSFEAAINPKGGGYVLSVNILGGKIQPEHRGGDMDSDLMDADYKEVGDDFEGMDVTVPNKTLDSDGTFMEIRNSSAEGNPDSKVEVVIFDEIDADSADVNVAANELANTPAEEKRKPGRPPKKDF